MESTPKYFDPRTLAKLANLRLRARHIVEGYVAGLHRSPWRGFSIEFAEHREYAPGDDLRRLDWKVYGRTDKLYLKQYEDETNLICYLVVDSSESMRYRGPESALSKWEYTQCVAAALSWLVLQQRDAVGLATFSDQVEALVRPSGSAAHWREILHVLDVARPGKKTSAGAIFHELAERLGRRGVVLILSDLFDDVASIAAGLKHLRHRKHDVVVLHTLDRAELDFPFRQQTLFKGLEQMPDVLADPAALRKAYLREFHQFLGEVQKGCRACGVDYRQLPTDEPFDRAISTWLSERLARWRA